MFIISIFVKLLKSFSIAPQLQDFHIDKMFVKALHISTLTIIGNYFKLNSFLIIYFRG